MAFLKRIHYRSKRSSIATQRIATKPPVLGGDCITKVYLRSSAIGVMPNLTILPEMTSCKATRILRLL